jgi:hypothetical protein
VPWCEDCARYYTPNSLPKDGTCPTCGRVIAQPRSERLPWHFWLLLVAVCVYLGWRAVQGVMWVMDVI